VFILYFLYDFHTDYYSNNVNCVKSLIFLDVWMKK